MIIAKYHEGKLNGVSRVASWLGVYIFLCKFWSSHRSVMENSGLLGCDTLSLYECFLICLWFIGNRTPIDAELSCFPVCSMMPSLVMLSGTAVATQWCSTCTWWWQAGPLSVMSGTCHQCTSRRERQQLVLLTGLREQLQIKEALSTSCGKLIVVITVITITSLWWSCGITTVIISHHHVFLFSISQCYCQHANCSHLH